MKMILENVVEIGAPKSVAWSVTMDIECWPQWTPTVTFAKRLGHEPFARGSSVLIRQPGLPEAKWVVTELTPGGGFTWESRIRGMRMIATHELSASGAGTRSVLRLEMRGIVARLMWPLIRASARRSLELENAGLKARCEALAARRN